MTEQELLVHCLRRLNRTGITYYLTRSMASNYWGIPRTTHDLDFVIQLLPSAIGRIVSAFSPDYFIDAASMRAAYQPPHQFNAIDTRSALKVDFSALKGLNPILIRALPLLGKQRGQIVAAAAWWSIERRHGKNRGRHLWRWRP
jgi:hypothetical protein